MLPIYAFVLKRYPSAHTNPFYDGIREGYTVKAIGHHPLYAYEATRQLRHSLCKRKTLRELLH